MRLKNHQIAALIGNMGQGPRAPKQRLVLRPEPVLQVRTSVSIAATAFAGTIDAYSVPVTYKRRRHIATA